jgi:hypothetical protein
MILTQTMGVGNVSGPIFSKAVGHVPKNPPWQAVFFF